jgi:hypothetical protein
LTSKRFRAGRHPALVARFQRLLDDARRVGLRAARPAAAEDTAPAVGQQQIEETLRSVQITMTNCQTFAESAHNALQLLMEHAGATKGHLFAVQAVGGLVPMAASAEESPSRELMQLLQQYLDREFQDCVRATNRTRSSCSESPPCAWTPRGRRKFPGA